jgi:hypothetical protein
MAVSTIIEIVSGSAGFLASLVGLVWWFSQKLASLVKAQTSMKEDLTATIIAQVICAMIVAVRSPFIDVCAFTRLANF